MPIQSKKTALVFKGKKVDQSIPPDLKKREKDRMPFSFRQLNPFNWFNDLTEIFISMEEFIGVRKNNSLK